MAHLVTILPALGLLGLALYQAVNLHDLNSAGQSIGQAAVLLGISHGVQALKSQKPGS